MEKANLDWNSLGFSCTKTPFRYISYWRDDKWGEGTPADDNQLTVNEGSPTPHHGQQCFEGLKAYRCADGSVNLLRPNENAKRLQKSCTRLLMPQVSVETLASARQEVMKASLAYLPPYGTDGTSYFRPCMTGVSDNIGIAPVKEYIFSIFYVPVGPYFKNGLASTNSIVSEYDRVAGRGTGAARVRGNYIASLLPGAEAHKKEFSDCICLDPYTRTKIEEVGAANFFGITKDGTFITPKSASILPSIAKYSLLTLAKKRLGMTALEEDVYIDRSADFSEAGACGMAAIISPIGGIQNGTDFHVFYSETEVELVTKQLYDELVGIQFGDEEAPEGWTVKVQRDKGEKIHALFFRVKYPEFSTKRLILILLKGVMEDTRFKKGGETITY